MRDKIIRITNMYKDMDPEFGKLILRRTLTKYCLYARVGGRKLYWYNAQFLSEEEMESYIDGLSVGVMFAHNMWIEKEDIKYDQKIQNK